MRTRRPTSAYGRIPHHADLNLESWTVEFVAIRADAMITSEVYWLITKGEESPYYAYLQYDSGNVTWKLHCGLYDDTPTDFPVLSGPAGIQVQASWCSLAMTYDAATDTFATYVGGTRGQALFTSGYTDDGGSVLGSSGTPNSNSDDIHIGAAFDGTDVARMSFREIRISSVARSFADLNANLEEMWVGNEANLVALYRGDEQTGSIMYDRSGNGHDCELMNGAEFTDGPTDLTYPVGMVRHSLIGWENLTQCVGTTITASEEAADYGVVHLYNAWPCVRQAGDPERRPVWRSDDLTGTKWILFDLGSRRLVNAVLILGHNCSSQVELDVKCKDTDASWNSPAAADRATFYPSSIYVILSRPRLTRYVRVEITDPAAAGGYLEIGALAVFRCLETSIDPTLMSIAHGSTDDSALVVSPHGHATVREEGKRDSVAIGYDAMPRAEAEAIRKVMREAGQGTLAWLVPDPLHRLYEGRYGYLMGLPSEDQKDSPSWDFESVGPIAIESAA